MPSAQSNKEIRIDTAVINSFLNGASESFNEMVHISPSFGQPALRENSLNHRWEISGIIEVSGECNGVIAVRLPSVLSEKILEKRGVSFSNAAERELLITKFVKRFVNKTTIKAAPKLSHYNINLKKPYIVYGKNHVISWPENKPIIGIPFRTTKGTFELEASIAI